MKSTIRQIQKAKALVQLAALMGKRIVIKRTESKFGVEQYTADDEYTARIDGDVWLTKGDNFELVNITVDSAVTGVGMAPVNALLDLFEKLTAEFVTVRIQLDPRRNNSCKVFSWNEKYEIWENVESEMQNFNLGINYDGNPDFY
jgi:hypothetical protein